MLEKFIDIEQDVGSLSLKDKPYSERWKWFYIKHTFTWNFIFYL